MVMNTAVCVLGILVGFLGCPRCIFVCFPSVVVGCAFAIKARRDVVLISLLFSQVSKWERERHKEVK